MSEERIIATDEDKIERYPIVLRFKRGDLKVLELICKKIIRMHGIGAVYPDLTEKELELVRLIWEFTNKTR